MTCGKQVAKGEEKLDGKLPINRTLREKERLMTLKEEFWREREERRQKGGFLSSVVGDCGQERRYFFDNLAILC